MKIYKILFAIIIILLLVNLFLILLPANGNRGGQTNLSTDDNAERWNGEQELPKSSLSETPAIAIPGFNEMVFIANQRTQDVNFYNPEINNCLFLMSLYVDEELLWQSGYIKPGDCYYQIELNKGLEASTNFKNGCLRIQCYKPDGTVLNSAKINFNLLVIEKGDI